MPENRPAKNRPTFQDPEKLKQLRGLTGEGMMDCKKALYACEGDMEKAQEYLQEGTGGCRLVYPARGQSSYDKGLDLLRKIWFNWPEEDKEWFRNEDPIAMHSSLGMHLRNHCGMWQVPWVPELRGNIDYSKNHPDAISQQVIKDFQAIVKG